MHTIQLFETHFSVCILEKVFHLKGSTMIIVIVSKMAVMNQKRMPVTTVYFIAHSKNGTLHGCCLMLIKYSLFIFWIYHFWSIGIWRDVDVMFQYRVVESMMVFVTAVMDLTNGWNVLENDRIAQINVPIRDENIHFFIVQSNTKRKRFGTPSKPAHWPLTSWLYIILGLYN